MTEGLTVIVTVNNDNVMYFHEICCQGKQVNIMCKLDNIRSAIRRAEGALLLDKLACMQLSRYDQ